MLKLELTETQAVELKSFLAGALGEMSAEIADTDNPRYRASLVERRSQLTEVMEHLTTLIENHQTISEIPPAALYQELAHPGG